MKKLIALLLFSFTLAIVDQGVLILPLANGLRYKTTDAVLNAGKVHTYSGGTLTAKSTYTTAAKTTAAANPIVLDAYGRATAYALTDGVYKFVIKDSASVTIDTWDNMNFASVVNDINSVNIGVVNAKLASFTDATITGDAFGKGWSWDSSTANEVWSIKREAEGLDFDYSGSMSLRITQNGIVVPSLNVSGTISATTLDVSTYLTAATADFTGRTSANIMYVIDTLYADNIAEITSAHGVSIDGLLIIDNGIQPATTMVINDSGNDADIRIESEDDENIFFIDSDAGNIGIGKNDATATLDVNGTVSVNALVVSTSVLVTEAGGNVGIGIADPQTKLEVNGTISCDLLVVSVSVLVTESGGNVGINEDNPQTTLEVGGTISANVLQISNVAGTHAVKISGDVLIDGTLNLKSSHVQNYAIGEIIAITTNYVIVDTYGAGPASEDLETITGGLHGDIVILRAENNARTTVIKDGVGNIKSAGDFSLDNASDHIMLIYDGSNWCEISRSNNDS